MKIFQFRVILRNIEPAIWRRVQVSADCSFWELHCAVQDAMGWLDDHLHSFWIPAEGSKDGVEIGIPDPRGFGSSKVRAGWKTRVDEYLKEEGDWVSYLYDFGDSWRHEVELEKVLDPEEGAEYPRCVDGARACPPEDCGGSWRYGYMLEVIADPDHEEYGSVMDWLGDEFDPEKFSTDDVNFLDPGMSLRNLLKNLDGVETESNGAVVVNKNSSLITVNDIMGLITYYRGELQKEGLKAAVGMREEITPHLLQALKEFVASPEEYVEDEDRALHLNALLLLAQFRETGACPLVLDICKLPQEYLEPLFGEFLTEYMDRVIASVFDGDLEKIKSVVEDASLYEYARASALTSLQILVHMGVLNREDVIEYYTELFRGGLEKEHSLVWDELACEAVDLHAVELAEDIQKKYETGLLDPAYMTPAEAKRALALTEEEALRTAKEMCRGPIDDSVSIMEGWLSPAVKRNRHPVPDEYFGSSDEYYRDGNSLKRTEPKVGRNDPCPCGSGKKYKKCCGK